MLIQTTAKSEWKEVLIIWGFETRMISLKIYNSLITPSTSSEVIGLLLFCYRHIYSYRMSDYRSLRERRQCGERE